MLLKNPFAKKSDSKKAILIYNNNDGKLSADLMAELLNIYHYELNVLGPEESTKNNILHQLKNLASESKDNQRTILYYCGRGFIDDFYEGIIVNDDIIADFPSIISPADLYEAVNELRGKKAIILDACHTGMFVDFVEDKKNVNAPLKDYVIIASCPQECVSYRVHETEVGYLTSRILVDIIKQKGPINLSNINLSPMMNENYIKRLEKSGLKHTGKKASVDVQRIFDIEFIL